MGVGDDDMPLADIIAELELDSDDDAFDWSGDAPTLGVHVVRWRDLPDEEARAEWAALRDWVEWLTVRYDVPVSVVPTCWWRHGALVEELSALHTAWRTGFDATDSGFGPVGWHERWALAQARLRHAYTGSCSSGHKDPKHRSWAGTTDDEEWDAWTSQAHGT
tara:strand:- start:36219 stop:36707 length:489 start_codon:yes stop_codon:yes gene_type:complete